MEIYQSQRVGGGGVIFAMYKIRTLRSDSNVFGTEKKYTRFGRFLRKIKADELPQIWNVLKGEMAFFGWRPMEKWEFDILPPAAQNELKKYKPGIVDLASLYFYDEERSILAANPEQDYWLRIMPQKIALQLFYAKNKSVLLNIALIWMVIKKLITRS